jgi:hypothetical protein
MFPKKLIHMSFEDILAKDLQIRTDFGISKA